MHRWRVLWTADLLLTVFGISLEGPSFLQLTLDRIHKERIDDLFALQYNQTDQFAEVEEERYQIQADDNPLESNNENVFEITFNEVGEPTLTRPGHGQHEIKLETQQDFNDVKEPEKEEGLYYYYYPGSNHHLDQGSSDEEISPESAMMSIMMESAMKQTMMSAKPQTNVTPLFRAVTWFMGTAMVFILSILLMPKFKTKKSKVLLYENLDKENWLLSNFSKEQLLLDRLKKKFSSIN